MQEVSSKTVDNEIEYKRRRKKKSENTSQILGTPYHT